MKYELDTEEYKEVHLTARTMLEGFMALGNRLVDALERTAANEHELRVRRMLLDEKKEAAERKDSWTPDEDEESESVLDEDTEDSVESEAQSPFPAVVGTIPYKEKEQPPALPPLTPHQENGKIRMREMVEMWIENFNVVGIQPDRLAYIESLSVDAKGGGSVVSFALARKGLTRAVHEVLQEMSGPDADPAFSRAIAGNITQVCSIKFTHLADQFEYPNPLLEKSNV
jgi:hypothetical protein